jgi:hypothetical protein
MATETTTPSTIAATTPDRDEILRVVELYYDGMGKGDAGRFREAFHADAWIFYTDADGVLHNGPLVDRFEGWATGDGDFEGRIIAVTQAGDVASVLLELTNGADPSDSWVDFHALLRVDGAWKITNKTSTHSSRAAWAKG